MKKRPLTFDEVHIDSCVRIMSFDITSSFSSRVLTYIINTLGEMAVEQHFLNKKKDGS